ncbi:MAG TPA: tyrosine-type recombinase/integrase, partial [Terriglobia bacterium]|nr:tyrosine-type recombinase/integrase [Terriglobia bacterium]
MDELIERYVEYLRYERNASPHTIRNYRSDLLQLRDFLARGNKEAKVDIKTIDHHHIRAFLAFLFQKQEEKASVARKLAAIRAFFKFLSRERLLTENPAATISTPKLEKKLPRIMTEEEMNTFLDRVAQAAQTGDPAIHRDRAIMELLYASGLRVSELAGMDLRNVNFGDSFVLVRGKGSKERIVPFGSKAKAAMEAYLPFRERLLRETRTGITALFLNARGQRLTTRSVDRLLKRYVQTFGP